MVEPCGAGRGERGFLAPHRCPLLREEPRSSRLPASAQACFLSPLTLSSAGPARACVRRGSRPSAGGSEPWLSRLRACSCCVCPLPSRAVRAMHRTGDTLPCPTAVPAHPSPHRQVVTPANPSVTRWWDHFPLDLLASWPEEPEVMWIGRQAPRSIAGSSGGPHTPSPGSSEQG